jgi:L-alanine-DL-glutamate epimerase-like enolase superfamily enzyme
MNFFITGYSIVPKTLTLHTPFNISLSEHKVAENIFIILRGQDGLVGIAEAAPFPALTGDNHHEVLRALQSAMPLLIGAESFQDAKARAAKLRKDCPSSPTAMAAIEMALIDLEARSKGLSLTQYFSKNICREEIETDITIPILSRSELKSFIGLIQEIGFRTFKFKVGSANMVDDIERIRTTLDGVGPDFKFTLDGNQNMSMRSCLSLLNELSRMGLTPQFFEQPLPQDQWAESIALTAESPVPICADELVKTAADAQRVVNDRAANMINLKNTKSGPFETLEIIKIATKHGVPLMIGGMIETEIAMTFSLHMACAFPAIKYFDLDTPFFFDQAVTPTSPYARRSPILKRPVGPGIGLTLS